MFRTLIDRLLKRDRSSSRRELSLREWRVALLYALQSRTPAEVATWTNAFRNIVKHETRRRRAPFRTYSMPALRLEALEDRRLLANFFWQGDVNSNWSADDNWVGGAAPGNGAVLVFDTNTAGFANDATAFGPINDIPGLTGTTIQIVDDVAGAGNTFDITGNPLTLAPGVAITNADSTSADGISTIRMDLTLSGDTTFDNAAGFLSIRAVDNAGSNLTSLVSSINSRTDFTGVISGSGDFNIEGVSATSSLTLSNAAHAYTGATNVNSGQLELFISDSLPDLSPLTVATGAVFDTAGFPEVVGSLAGGGEVQFGPAGPGLTVGENNSDTDFSGTITGGGTLSKRGSGTMTISGNVGGLTGGLSHTDGTVLVTGTFGGAVIVGDLIHPPTLGGTGTITGLVQVGLTDGVLSPGIGPGFSPGILTVLRLTTSSRTTYEIELNGTNPGNAANNHDQIVSTSTSSAPALNNAGLNVTLGGGFTPTTGDQFTIIDNQSSSAIVGTFNGLPEGATVTAGGSNFTISYVGGTGNDVVLTVTGPFIIDADQGTGNGRDNNNADDFRVVLSGAAIEVYHNGELAPSQTADIGLVTQVIVNGSGDDDMLTVDLTNGDPFPGGGLFFDGGTGGNDVLKVVGGTFTTIRKTFTNANDGTIDFGDNGVDITYAGLEPVLLNVGSVNDIILDLPVGPNSDVLLADDGIVNFGVDPNGNTTRTSAIDGSTFEFTEFTNPLNSLTVNLGNNGDTMNVMALDAAYAASLMINGGAANNDDVQVNNTTISGTAGTGLQITNVETLGIANSLFNGNATHGIELSNVGDVDLVNVTADNNSQDGLNLANVTSLQFFTFREVFAMTHLAGSDLLFADNDTNLGVRSTNGLTSVVGQLDHESKGLAFSGADLLSVAKSDDQLRTIDASDASTLSSVAITLAGQTIDNATGLATDPTNGDVFGLLKLQGQFGRELVTIDPATGIATSVGDTGDKFATLAFDAVGVLHGVTGDGASIPETLFTLDKTTAVATQVLELGNGDDGEALAFNPNNGLFYHASGLSNLVFESVDLSGPTVQNIPLSADVGPGHDVTISNSSFSGNTREGAAIVEVGNLSLTNVTADGNQGGLDLATLGSLTIDGGSYSANRQANIFTDSITGLARLTNVTVNASTGGDGIIMVRGALSLDVTGGTFSGNDGLGLLIDAFPNGVTMSDVAVNNNGHNGFDLLNAGRVDIIGGSYSANAASGIVLDSVGDLAIGDVASTGNANASEIGTATSVALLTTTGMMADAVSITATTIDHTRGAAVQNTIEYTDVPLIIVDTNDGQDTIDVTPSPDAAISIFGGDPANPTATPDTVNFSTPAGESVTLSNPGPDSGTIVSSQITANWQEVNFDEIELLTVFGDIIIDGTSMNDVLVVDATSATGGTFQLTSGGVAGPVVSFTADSLTFRGMDGVDELRINHAPGALFSPAGGIFYDGAGGVGDFITLDGGPTATTITHTFDNENDGTIDWDGTVLTYTGLEPVFDNMSANNRVFQFTDPTASGEVITLSDDAQGLDDVSQIDSTAGEIVRFTNPTAALAIETAVGGGAGADAVNVEGLDPRFDAHLTINADNDDTVNFQTNPTNIDAGDLAVFANKVDVNASIATAGSIVLTSIDVVGAGDDLTVATGVSIESTASTVDLRAGDDLRLDGTVSVMAFGNLTLIGGFPVLSPDAIGNIIMADGSLASAGGDIDVDATGAVGDGLFQVGRLVTTSNSAGAVNISAAGVVDAGDVGGVDIEAANATAVVTIFSSGDIGAAANSIETNLTNLVTETIDQGDDQFISETDGLASIDLDAATGDIVLTAGGAILDTDAGVDVRAAGAAITATGGIGVGGNAINSDLSTLAANNSTSGDIVIANDVGGLLTIGTVHGVAGIDNSGGDVLVSNASPLTVSDDVLASGNVTITASDSAASDDDLIVSNAVPVQSTGGDVILRSGDDVSIESGSTIDAAGTVTIEGDFGNADVGMGSVIDILGTIKSANRAVVLGAGDNDRITLDPDFGSSGDILLDGQGGTDDYLVQLSNLGGQVDIDDQAGEGIDNLTINGTDGAETLTVSATSTSSGSETVSYTAELEFLAVKTFDDADTIAVTPSPDLEIDISGGAPTVSPGDTLNFTTPALHATTLSNLGPDSGRLDTVGTGNFLAVSFEEIEDVSVAGAITVDGGGQDDVLEITATASDAGSFLLTTNLLPGPTVSFSSNNSFTFNAGNGNDELVVNHPAGSLFAPAGGIFYNGQGSENQSDILTVVGGNATTVTHAFANANDGTIDWDGTTLTYTGLEPITDNMSAANRVFQFTDPMASGETITLADDVRALANISEIDSTAGEIVTFINPTDSLTIQTASGGGTGTDAVNIEGLDDNFSANLTVDADTDDTINFQNTSTNIGAGTLNVTANAINIGVDNITSGGNQNYSGSLTLQASTSLAGANVFFHGTVDNGGSDLTIQVSGTMGFAAAEISGSGGLTKQGTGQWNLNTANTYTGVTNVNAGELWIFDGAGLGEADADSQTVVADGAELYASGVFTVNEHLSLMGELAVGSLGTLVDWAGPIAISGGNAILEPGTAFDELIVSGQIVGSGGFENRGDGKLTLSNANPYTGPTLVTGAGTVIVTGSTPAASTVTVEADATLGGTGTVGGSLNVQGTVAPGLSPGILNTGDVDFQDGSTFQAEMGGNTPGNGAGFHDQLNVTGTVAIRNNVRLVTSPFDDGTGATFVPTVGDQFVIINNDGTEAVGGTFVNLAEGAVIPNFIGSGLNVIISYVGGTGNDVVLTAALPELRVAIMEASISENGGIANATVTRNSETFGDLAVNLTSDMLGEATVPMTVTIFEGQTSTAFMITGVNEEVVDGTKNVTISASAMGFTPGTDTIDVTDDDATTVSIMASDPTGNETAPDDGTFTISLDGGKLADTGGIAFNFNVGGTASAGTDYTSLGVSTTIPAGQNSVTVDVTGIVDDSIVEADETVIVTLTGTNNPNVLVNASATTDTVTITDNDTATFSIDDVTVDEADGTATFTVSLSNPLDLAVDVDVSYADVTATGGTTDYDSAPDTVSFAAGTTTAQTVTVAITDDNIVELTETFTASLSLNTATPTGARSVDTSDTGTGTITDNDTATFSIDDVTVDEADGTATFTVSLSNPLDLAVEVDVSYADVTATGGGTDYDSAPDTVSFAAGSTTAQTVTVAITDDNIVELTETFTASLSLSTATPTGARSVDTSDTRTGTITDNDATTVSVMADDGDASEQLSDAGPFTLSLDNGKVADAGGIVVDFTVTGTASAGTDYTALPVSAIIPAGQNSVTLDVTGIGDDMLVEGDETVVLTVTGTDDVNAGVSGTADTATVTIGDNDTATFAINDVTVDEAAGTMTLTVSLNNPIDIPVVVDVTYTDVTAMGASGGAGGDYKNDADTASFDALDTADKMVTIAVIDDNLVEITETFTAALSTATSLDGRSANLTDTATGTITDNDLLLVEFSQSSGMDAESSGGNLPQLLVTGTIQTGHSVTIDAAAVGGTATGGGVDYNDPTTVTIAAGTYTATAVAITGLSVATDTLIESDETIDLGTLTGSQIRFGDANSDGTIQAATQYIIQDDDLQSVQTVVESPDASRLTITDVVPGGKDDQLELTIVGNNLVIADRNDNIIGDFTDNTTGTLVDVPYGSILDVEINLSGGDDQVSIDFSGAPSGFNLSLLINGGEGDDALIFTGSTPLGLGDLTTNDEVEDIFVNGPVTTQGGSVTLSASRSLEVNSNINTGVGGEVRLTASEHDIFGNCSLIQAGGADVHLVAGTGIAGVRVQTTGDVTLNGGSGGIVGCERGDTSTVEIDVESDQLTLFAGASVGKALLKNGILTDIEPLLTNVNRLDGRVDGLGIFIDNEGPFDDQQLFPATDPPGRKIITEICASSEGEGSPLQNAVNRLDVNNDGAVSPVDALGVVNYLNGVAVHSEGPRSDRQMLYVDVNGDFAISPVDALAIINYLNRTHLLAPEGESSAHGQVEIEMTESSWNSLHFATAPGSKFGRQDGPHISTTPAAREESARHESNETREWSSSPRSIPRAAQVEPEPRPQLRHVLPSQEAHDELEQLLSQIAPDVGAVWSTLDGTEAP